MMRSRAAAGPIDSSVLDGVFAQTGGNPLLVLEGLRNVAHSRGEQPEPALTAVAADLLERRLRSVPATTLRTLQAAAIFEGGLAVAAVGLGWLIGEDPLETLAISPAAFCVTSAPIKDGLKVRPRPSTEIPI